jgi:hypothetical protein
MLANSVKPNMAGYVGSLLHRSGVWQQVVEATDLEASGVYGVVAPEAGADVKVGGVKGAGSLSADARAPAMSKQEMGWPEGAVSAAVEAAVGKAAAAKVERTASAGAGAVAPVTGAATSAAPTAGCGKPERRWRRQRQGRQRQRRSASRRGGAGTDKNRCRKSSTTQPRVS